MIVTRRFFAVRGKKGEKWGNDKKIKFVRIRMTSCREATAAAPPLLTITLARSPLNSPSGTMLRRAALHRACMLSSLTKVSGAL